MSDSGYSLTDEALPLASCARVTSKEEIRGETEFARDWGEGLASVGAVSGSNAALEESLHRT